jgi:membrane protein implicated in regulation of membrane protease activity
MANWIAGLGPWAWIVLGLLLVGLELWAPGIFLIWLGVAAIATGLVDAIAGLSWQLSLLLFAILAVAAVLLGRTLSGRPVQKEPPLNRRGEVLVGRVFNLDVPISSGEGRIRVDDSSWRVVGPDARAGTPVRVTRVDGATLVVEPA